MQARKDIFPYLQAEQDLRYQVPPRALSCPLTPSRPQSRVVSLLCAPQTTTFRFCKSTLREAC